MRRSFTIALFSLLFYQAALARPEYMKIYYNDPFSKPQLRNSCLVCHFDPEGGGRRNAFGRAFDENGRRITAELRTNFPDMFLQDRALIEDIEIMFTDPGAGKIEIKKGNKVYEVDLQSRQVMLARVDNKPVEQVPEFEPPKRRFELPFDYYLVNLPTAKPMRKGQIDMRVTHRFLSPVFRQGDVPFDLFGFDSFNYPGMSFSFGVTDRLSLGVNRTTFGVTPLEVRPASEFIPQIRPAIEFLSDFNIAQESKRFPFSMVARAAIEGGDNFREFYSPSLQLMFARTATRFAQFHFVPTISFNTNILPEELARARGQPNYTVALGIGGAFKIRPHVALVGEYIPRAAGFKDPDPLLGVRPTTSFGIMLRTYKHVFNLVFTNAWGTTTSRYTVGGSRDFRIGFNVWRQLR